MTQLAQDINRRFKSLGRTRSVPVFTDAVIFLGAHVAVNAAGYLVPAADTAGLQPVGVAEEAQDNTGGAAGDLRVRVRLGTAELENDSGSPVDQSDVGRVVYVLDDNTVTKTAGATNDIIAGVLDSIDDVRSNPGSVWVSLIDSAAVAAAGGAQAYLGLFTNATRPDPATLADGSWIFNSTDNAPNYIDSGAWQTAIGNPT